MTDRLTPAAMYRVALVEAAALHVRAAADFRSMPASYPTAPAWAEAHDRVAALLALELAATDEPRTRGEPVDPCEVDEPAIGDEPRVDTDRSPRSASVFRSAT